MQSKIDYSPRALKDLDEIWDYIEVELCNPSAAQNTVDGIMDKVEGIAAFPESGAKLVFENGLDSGYRYVVFKNNIYLARCFIPFLHEFTYKLVENLLTFSIK